MNLLDPETLRKLGQLILTDLVLAGDNALVIAMATRSLPPRQQFWGRLIGAGGAVGLRVAFVAVIAHLVKVPFLQLVGGLLLLWICWKLIQPQQEAGHNPEAEGKYSATTLGQAIWVIMIADVTMSFDNVLAITNISGGDMSLVIFGLLFSIPLVVWGSTLISKLMERFRWIIWVGGAVLGHVAGDIIFRDARVLAWLGETPESIKVASPWMKFIVIGVPWLMGAAFFFAGWWFSRKSHAVKDVPKTEEAPSA